MQFLIWRSWVQAPVGRRSYFKNTVKELTWTGKSYKHQEEGFLAEQKRAARSPIGWTPRVQFGQETWGYACSPKWQKWGNPRRRSYILILTKLDSGLSWILEKNHQNKRSCIAQQRQWCPVQTVGHHGSPCGSWPILSGMTWTPSGDTQKSLMWLCRRWEVLHALACGV